MEGLRLFLLLWRTSRTANYLNLALASVSRRLIEAQEQERLRISRELHDDIAQRVALLAIELQQLLEDPSEPAGASPNSRSRLPR